MNKSMCGKRDACCLFSIFRVMLLVCNAQLVMMRNDSVLYVSGLVIYFLFLKNIQLAQEGPKSWLCFLELFNKLKEQL